MMSQPTNGLDSNWFQWFGFYSGGSWFGWRWSEIYIGSVQFGLAIKLVWIGLDRFELVLSSNVYYNKDLSDRASMDFVPPLLSPDSSCGMPPLLLAAWGTHHLHQAAAAARPIPSWSSSLQGRDSFGQQAVWFGLGSMLVWFGLVGLLETIQWGGVV